MYRYWSSFFGENSMGSFLLGNGLASRQEGGQYQHQDGRESQVDKHIVAALRPGLGGKLFDSFGYLRIGRVRWRSAGRQVTQSIGLELDGVRSGLLHQQGYNNGRGYGAGNLAGNI